MTDVFRKDGRVVPIFNDKHLSWNWDWAKEMVDISRELKFPFLAGSSLPVTWRMPVDRHAATVPRLKRLMCVAIGGIDSYDFHALEVMQCMAERRKGGETGVGACKPCGVTPSGKRWMPALGQRRLEPEAVRSLSLSRSQTLAQPETFSHRYPTPEQIRDWVKDPVAYRFEYADGLKGDDAADERPGRRLHFRRQAEGPSRTALDAVLSAAESQRHLLGGI